MRSILSLIGMSVALMAPHESPPTGIGGGELKKPPDADLKHLIDVEIDGTDVTLSYDLGDVGASCQFDIEVESPTVIAERLEQFAHKVREFEARAQHNPPAQAVRNAEVDKAAERVKALDAASDDEIERTLEQRRGEQHVQMERDARAERGEVVEAMPPGKASDPIKPGPTEGRDAARSDQV